MGIIWDLFGVHIIFSSIILLLFIAWLIWPRKYKTIRKWLIRSAGLCLLIGILSAVIKYWPKSYDKTYLDQTPSYYKEDIPLRALADTINFQIGIAVSNDSLSHHYIPKEFNSITAENHFKPQMLLADPLAWKYNFSTADSIADIAITNDLRLRGHTLIWGKFPGRTYPIEWQQMIGNQTDKAQAVKDIIKRHIETVVGRYKNKVATWDVVNEPMGGATLYSNIFSNALGEEYIDYSFRIAHEVDPDCALFLNEAVGDYNGPMGQEFLKLLQRLLDRGVPIHGVGLQTHHIFIKHDVAALKSYMRAIAELGLQVEITELDMSMIHFADSDDPYKTQGKQYYDIVKACLDEPACQGLTLWGLSDARNWMDEIPPFKWNAPNAPFILDEDMNKKPAFYGVWRALHEHASL